MKNCRSSGGMLLCLWLAALVTASHGQEWPRWRGLDQGVSRTPLDHTAWSTNENVLWFLEIPGNGHSSPIVRGDRVYLTTAIAGTPHGLKRATQGMVIFGLTSLLLIGLITHGGIRLRQAAHEPPMPLMRTVPWFMMLGCITGVALLCYYVVGSTAQDHEAGIVRWLTASGILAACGVLALYGLPVRSLWRCGGALALAGLSAAVMLARPDPGYYEPLSGVQGTRGVLIVGSALPAVAGFLLVLGFLPRPLRQRGISSSGSATTSFPGWVFPGANLLACGLGVALPAVIYRTTALRESVMGLLGAGNTGPIQYLCSSFGALAVALLACTVLDIVQAPRRLLAIPIWLRCFLLLMGIGLGADLNWVSSPSVERAIIAVNRNTGERIWMAKALRSPGETLHQVNTSASPTPVADERAVYAYFGSAGAMAADADDGRLLWAQKDLPFLEIHGAGASPVLVNKSLVIISDMPTAPYLTALDIESGKRIWTTTRKPWKGQHGCHSTPVVTNVDGRDLIIVWSWRTLSLYDASNGKELAEVSIPGALGGQRTANPIVDGGRIYVSNMAQICALDLRKMLDGEPPAVWTTHLKHRGPNTSTPVLHSGRLFMVSDLGHVTCIETFDGRVLWQRSLRRRSEHFYSSPVVVGDKLLVSDTQGRSHLLNADDRGQSFSVSDLGTPIYASPAIVDGDLYIRTTDRLWCIGENKVRSH